MNRSTQQKNKSNNQDSGRFFDSLLDNLSTLITVMLFCAIAYGAVLAINHLDKPIAKVSIEGEFKYIEQHQFIDLVRKLSNLITEYVSVSACALTFSNNYGDIV